MSTAFIPAEIRCQAILFDMDGILISSLESVERSWAKWCSLRGVEFAAARAILHGCRAVDTVSRLRPDLDAEAEMKIIEDWEVADGEGVRILPGVPQVLAALPPHRWTVVTSATARLAPARMAQAGLPAPRQFVTADHVTWGKPHPEPYLAGAAILGFPPEQCVVFEDSESGTRAGRAAGCQVVATTFSHRPESLDAAHYVVEDLTGVQVNVLPGDEGLLLRLNAV